MDGLQLVLSTTNTIGDTIHNTYNAVTNVQLNWSRPSSNDHTRAFFGCFLGANQSTKVLCLEKAGSAFVPKAFDFTYLLVTLSNSPLAFAPSLPQAGDSIPFGITNLPKDRVAPPVVLQKPQLVGQKRI